MPSPDLVTESNTFKPSNDNRASSNAFSNEAWDCIDKGGRKANCPTNTDLSLGGKFVGGVGATVEARKHDMEREINQGLNKESIDVKGTVLRDNHLEKQKPNDNEVKQKDKEKSIDNDIKGKEKEKNNDNDVKDKTRSIEKPKTDCLDFNVPIDGYPKVEADPRKTQEQNRRDGGHGQGGARGPAAQHGWREHVPPSSKIDQDYGAWLEKLEDKNFK